MFTYPRYLDGQDDPKSNFTLERLHEVAKERSLERKKKKRKRELERDGLGLDCVEETCKTVKRLGFCDKLAPVKKKLKKRDQPMLTYENSVENQEEQIVKHKRHGRKQKQSIKMEEEEEEEEPEEDETVKGKVYEEVDVNEEEKEEEEEEDEEEEEEEKEKDLKREDKALEEAAEGKEGAEDVASSDRDGSPLRPLTHAQSSSSSRSGGVQRQLPAWITNPHVVENDINSFSRPVDDFSLPPLLVKNLSTISVKNFFPVQVHVVPYLMSHTHGPLCTGPGGATPPDVFVCAPTGCGKTLCYVLPIVKALVNRVLQQPCCYGSFMTGQVRALVVVPSHELTSQVLAVFDHMMHGTGLSAGRISGQLSLESECAMLHEPGSYPSGSKVDVLVATPGRLVEHLERGSFASLSYLRFLVIDEADKILDYHFSHWLPKLLKAVAADKAAPPGRGPRAQSLRSSLQALCSHHEQLGLWGSDHISLSVSQNRDQMSSPAMEDSHIQTSPLQKLLFSASMTYSPEQLSQLRLHCPALFTTQPVTLAARRKSGASTDLMFTLPSQLVEKMVRCDLEHKPLALLHLISGRVSGCCKEEMERVLVFTNSKDSTHRLYLLLKTFDLITVAEISGSVSHSRQQAILTEFRAGGTKVLICSDQMARGMDVVGVTCIVNYEPPRQYRIYLHRAGRTARAGCGGVVYSLVAKDEVHPFKVMIRKAVGNKQIQDLKITSSDLQDYLPHYQDNLDKLRQLIK